MGSRTGSSDTPSPVSHGHRLTTSRGWPHVHYDSKFNSLRTMPHQCDWQKLCFVLTQVDLVGCLTYLTKYQPVSSLAGDRCATGDYEPMLMPRVSDAPLRRSYARCLIQKVSFIQHEAQARTGGAQIQPSRFIFKPSNPVTLPRDDSKLLFW
jgi:hypothetical protein